MQKDETVFEASLRKQKEKRKAKKFAEKTGKEHDSESNDGEKKDEFDDPFFQTINDGSDFDNSQEDSGDDIGTASKMGKSPLI